MDDEKIRLSKLMSQLGICSRREADQLIAKGWVKVDGEVVQELGTKVSPNARVELTRQAHDQQNRKVTVLLNKPVGFVSTQPEDGYRAAIELITPENQWGGGKKFRPEHRHRLSTAGRLDIESQGLLVLTQDGVVVKKIIGETADMEKEYIVRVRGRLSDKDLQAFRKGLLLDGEQLKPVQVEWINDDQLRFILQEGKKRQIRRMCQYAGLTVTGLKRVRIGHVRLGDIPEGKWRYLSDDEEF